MSWVAGGLLLLAVASLVAAVSAPRTPGDTAAVARRAEKVLAVRLAKLEIFSEKALQQPSGEWLDLGKVPSDMVIYRYRSDSLQSWVNAFPQINDDIADRHPLSEVFTLRGSPRSPLAEVGEEWEYRNLGSKWYIVRSRQDEASGLMVVSALEVLNTLDTRSLNGVNSRLLVGDRYSVKPLSEDGGSEVRVSKVPVFKITYESLSGKSSADPAFALLALLFLVAGGFVFILDRRCLKRFFIVTACLACAMAVIFFWGKAAQLEVSLFSPALYAGGSFFYSLGVVLMTNLAIFLVSLMLYLVREDLYPRLSGVKSRIIAGTLAIAATAGVLAYVFVALRSIVLNSGIALELYKLTELSVYSALVYVSFLALLLSVPFFLKFAFLAIYGEKGEEKDVFSRQNRLAYSAAMAVYLVLITSLSGFQKEQNRVKMWANRIDFDRDISLEMRLERMEHQIANDATISMFSVFENTESVIQNRLSNDYFSRIDNGYVVSVFLLNNFTRSPENIGYVNSIIQGGVPVSDGSRFLYLNPSGAKSSYAGIFNYSVPGHGLSTMVITIENESADDLHGYAQIFGFVPPGRVVLPAEYSYARYVDDKLLTCKGDYAYPTVIGEEPSRADHDGFTHFFCRVNEDDTVVISRRSYGIVNYVVSFLLLAMALYFIASLPVMSGRRKKPFERSYYRHRISAVLLVSLSVALVSMALASVLFVTGRNESNLRSVMSDKVSAISVMLEQGESPLLSSRDLVSPPFRKTLQEVSDNTGSDITVFDPSGRLVVSTNPMVFNRVNLGSRMDGNAYREIILESRRFCMVKENIDRHSFYSMYAPIKSSSGDVIGVVCAPYTGESYDFEKDALNHSMTILAVVLLLLLLARFAVSGVIDRMFHPLEEMSRKMTGTSPDALEHIVYDRQDEVSSLVSAYNMMVTEIAENSKKLAQAERDKAWSGMARQVAHEIKNPLTPMKLQIQRIIRLKAKGDPSWQDKFDEVTGILLDHIDILTETANEFSTFAKLYTEDHTEIDLDKLLQEEMSMFDSKGSVRFEYIGLSNSVVLGPKPQLTRVFVNLINNAVQAVGDNPDAKVLTALRKSTVDGYYDIVVEDNGPGVSEENISKLFTPNFTTKSAGSGLGLAISRSILERCGATISYSRSFTLGGACFTIRYPSRQQ